jgi:hypothetical protein
MGAPGEPERGSGAEHGTATSRRDPCGQRGSTPRHGDRRSSEREQTGDGVARDRRRTDLATDDMIVQVVSTPEREGGAAAPRRMQHPDRAEAGGSRRGDQDSRSNMGHGQSVRRRVPADGPPRRRARSRVTVDDAREGRIASGQRAAPGGRRAVATTRRRAGTGRSRVTIVERASTAAMQAAPATRRHAKMGA